MGVKKGIYYGFSGYRAPAIPRAPRSIRKRGSQKKLTENTKVSAFEILATVAGKLLEETESSSASSNAAAVNNQPFGIDMIKEEQQDIDNPVKAEGVHQGRCEEKVFVSGLASHDRYTLEEFPCGKSDAILECVSVITSLNYPDNINSDVKLANTKRRNLSGLGEIANKVVKVTLDHQGDSHGSNIHNGTERQPQSESDETRDLTVVNTCNSIQTIAHVDRKVELPLCKHPTPGAYFDRHRNDVDLGSKDDDENFSRCHKRGTKVRAFRQPPHIGDRRIRKLLKSKYWKVAPKLKTCETSNACGEIKPAYHKRKAFYTHKRSKSDNFLKRRKLLDQSLVVTTDGGSSGESFANSSEMGMYGDKSASVAALQGVKLSIKSFKVPELFIEVPESATVGLLKRTVMEAVSAMLESGLHVGVLLRGKKLRDDNTTLLQTGISHNGSLDALGFSLEPTAAQAPLLSSHEDPPFSLSCDSPQPLIRPSATPVSDARFSDVSPDLSLVNALANDSEINHDQLSSPTNILTNKTVPDSKALVAVPPMSVETLPVAPVNHKSRRSEFTQRRTRRPFSVSEVEALVHAVEELGTGRWRDVKLRAFDNANHRTYVDLKDKWKTLVHTAKISPQQRRGEPVPQQLLDRVLCAHSYWTQHHDKQHGKYQSRPLTISESQAEIVRV